MPISILSSRFLMWAQADDQFKLFVKNQDFANCLEGMPFYMLSFFDKKKIDVLSKGYFHLLEALKSAKNMTIVHHLLEYYAKQLAEVVDGFLKTHSDLIVTAINQYKAEYKMPLIQWSEIQAGMLRGCLLKMLSFSYTEDADKASPLLIDHLTTLNNGNPVNIHSQLSKLVTALFKQERIVNKSPSIRSISYPVSRPDVDNPGRYMRF